MDPPRSCILCRGIKAQCINDHDYANPCHRCRRLGLPCAYTRKRRNPKKPEGLPFPKRIAFQFGESEVAPHPIKRSREDAMDRSPLQMMLEEAVSSPMDSPASGLRSAPAVPSTTVPGSSIFKPSSSRALPAVLTSPMQSASEETSNSHRSTGTAPRKHSAADTDVSSYLDPGDFSSTDASWSQSGPYDVSDRPRPREVNDPIRMGYITPNEGERLVQLSHQFLNPQISLLDPELHTYTYMRERSSLLLSSVLAASCKYFKKELYTLLLEHAQRLLSRAVEQAECDIGVMQAALTMVYWKQPTDKSAWLKVGLAIRIGYQLGMHKEWFGAEPTEPETERQKLDWERTWFCTFAFDRTYASFFSLPPTIRPSELGDCQQWAWKHSHLPVSELDMGLAFSVYAIRGLDLGNSLGNNDGLKLSTALMELEGRQDHSQELLRRLDNWARPSQVTDRKLATIRMSLQSVLLAIQARMLDFVPPEDTESMKNKCLEAAVEFVDQIRDIEDQIPFMQDVLSARIASFGSSMQSVFWRLTARQRQLAITSLRDVHDICVKASDNDPHAATAFVARFLARLLRGINVTSKQMGRNEVHEAVSTQSEPEIGELSAQMIEPMEDLMTFLDTTSSFLNESLSLDEQYWSSLFIEMPSDMSEVLCDIAI